MRCAALVAKKVKPTGPGQAGRLFGHAKVRGLHFQIVTVKTTTCAPVTVATGLRAESAHFSHKVVDVWRKAGARFSPAVEVTKTIRAAIETIDGDAWMPIKYTDAIWDEDEGHWSPTPRQQRFTSRRSPARRRRSAPPPGC
ncbi:hypothetical protein ACTVZO_18210 [Streptomyces sp. IBSNAI002]|uniref:hypothetical protein n=1 Tax=Streptomyces sp. IBSNAI002 TaxID=3457500 RepID=UPI003FD0CF8C